MTRQTVSSVHSMAELSEQRWQALLRDRCALSAMGVYAQTAIGFSLYMYGHVSTPGWLSLVLCVPFSLLLWAMARYLLRCGMPGKDAISAAAGPDVRRAAYLAFFLVCLLDAQLCFYSLCALVRDVMPDHSALFTAVAVALCCAFALNGPRESAMPRMGRVIKWLVGALFFYCLCIALPHGKPAHFFPLLGYGAGTIGKGALWLCGAVGGGVWPLILEKETESVSLMKEKRHLSLRPWLLALGAGFFTYLTSAWLLPVYALAKPENLGWRMLLVAHMTPSVPAWSMQVLGLLLLLFLALSYHTGLACTMLCRFTGATRSPRALPTLLLFLMAPASALELPSIQRFLTDIASLRGAVLLGTLALLCLLARAKQKAWKVLS